MTEVPKAKDLKVPLKKIHPDTRIKAFQHIEDEATLIPLYDTRAYHGNWPLPESHLDKLTTSGERSSNKAGENSSMDQGEREGESNGAMNQRSGDWVIVNDTDTPAGSESQVKSVGQPEDNIMSTNASSASSDKAPVLHEINQDSTKPWMTKQVFASFNNLLTFALLPQKPALAQKHNLSHIWSTLNSSSTIHGNEITRKPDLTLLNDIKARWDTIKVICELTSSAYLPSHSLAKTLDTKAYLLLKHQPWRHFTLLVSICNGYRELHIHLYDHSSVVVSPCMHIDQEPDKYLQIFSSIVFGNLKCIGLDPMITILRHTLHCTLRSPDFRVAKPSPSPHQTAKAIPDVLIMESETTEIEEIMSEPPHTIEDAVPNPAANIPPNWVPLIDEVPSNSLSEPLPEPIGKIQVNENMYDILDLIFSTQGLVGRGTVCYLARKDEEEYIVKDHWVLGSKSEVLNEIYMMEKMDGIHGVPRLVKYWLVEMEPGKVDETVKYHQKVPHSIKGTSRTHVCLVLKPYTRPLYEFHSCAEFLTLILDIIKIQKQAVEQNQVLHCNCSLNNAMIEDDGDGTHGMLIDWEFAVEIVQGDQYGVGGTGTVPFMLQSLLFQLYLHTLDPSDECLGTHASGSKPYPPPMVTHVYQDDLESMFYVFIWSCLPMLARRKKCKAVDSDGQANSAKKSCAGAQASAVLQEPILADKPSARCSGHPGVGKGGRAEQLEKIGALLDAPMRTTQPKGSTSLDLDVPTNPLAPKPSRKGRGSRSKASLFLLILDGNVKYRQKPPPPYTVSETVVDPATSKTGRKKATSKVTKNALTPTTDVNALNTQPTFSHCQPGGWFGFAQSIVPPSMEPDLQALNNPFVAATREKCALSVSLDPNRRLLPTDTSRNNNLAQPAPSKSRSSMQINTTFHKNLDPALLSVGDVCSGAGYTRSKSSEASTDDNNDDGGHADDDEEEHEEEEEEGDVEGQEVRWGAVHECLTAHPSFSKEVEPSQPWVTTALPTDFEFQHSCDEDNNMADKNLAAGTSSDDDNIPDDVLQLHHKQNGHPCLPDPAVLDLLCQAETKPPNSKLSDTNIKAHKVSAKITGEGPKATQLGWYGPHWKRFLEETKGECHVQHVIENPFLTFIDSLSGTIPEILTALLVQWLESSQQVEGNIWPDYKPEMAKLLFEDLSTWHLDLKKIAISITPSMYDLVPPSHVPPQERAMWVKERAEKLLESSFFLCNGVDSLGKT
ncbi:hypothetical protein BDR06DRAFT_1013678 [Suillus hirtellus]|nr:hypothetical protein BDR06DRAFT_1013678 [Suillus hirtellus]